MAPLPPLGAGLEEGSGEAAEVKIVAQVPDALTVQGDVALWNALTKIQHFPLSVDALRDYYR